jgi:hypothetical protein
LPAAKSPDVKVTPSPLSRVRFQYRCPQHGTRDAR